jgi:arginyl-tRNA--protein-N-Asp/Glu arginylyltransferase
MPSLRGALIDAGDCPYLPGRRFTAFTAVDPVDGPLYRLLLDHRFRRNGEDFYAPHCADCQACQPIRVAVAGYAPRRDQRRAWARNADLAFTWQPRGLDDERLGLWRRYQQVIHGETPGEEPRRFLCADAGIPGGELHARDAAGRLLAVSVCDVVGDAWSSVYCYWEPTERGRGLGTVMAMAEIAEAARRGLRWWYPGFWVAGCAAMAYKARFGPAEVLVDGQWVRRAGG